MAKKKRDNIKELLALQQSLDIEIAKDPNDENIEQAEKVREEIESYNKEKTMGAMLRSKAEWMEYGEKNSRFFLRLENRILAHFWTKMIKKLQNRKKYLKKK